MADRTDKEQSWWKQYATKVENYIKIANARANTPVMFGQEGDPAVVSVLLELLKTGQLGGASPAAAATGQVQGEPLGAFEVTAYTTDPAENGGNRPTASGTKLTPHRSAAVNPSDNIPFGTVFAVAGSPYKWVAEDTGSAITKGHIDICVASKGEASEWGRKKGVAATKIDFVDVKTLGDKVLGTVDVSALGPGLSDMSTGSSKISYSGGRIVLPSTDRGTLSVNRYNAVKAAGYKGLAQIDTNKFKPTNVVSPEWNNFAPDFVPGLELIYQAAKKNFGITTLGVNSGLRYNWHSIEPHRSGSAMDFNFRNGDPMQRKFADMCWGLGFRGIGVGNNHVHVDCFSEGHWREDDTTPVYYGPGR